MSVFDDIVNQANHPATRDDDAEAKKAIFTDYGKAFRERYGDKAVDEAKEESADIEES